LGDVLVRFTDGKTNQGKGRRGGRADWLYHGLPGDPTWGARTPNRRQESKEDHGPSTPERKENHEVPT